MEEVKGRSEWESIAGIPLAAIDMRDPLIVAWVLRRLDLIRRADAEQAMSIERFLFNDITIKHLLDKADQRLLMTIISRIDYRCFTNHLTPLIKSWEISEDEDNLPAAKVIALLDPEQAVRIFKRFLIIGGNTEPDKMWDIFYALGELPEADASSLLSLIMDRYFSPLHSRLDDLNIQTMLSLTWRYDHPSYQDIFRKMMSPPGKSESDDYERRLRDISATVFDSATEFRLFLARLNGTTKQRLTDMAPFFVAGTPLAELDNLTSSSWLGKDQKALREFVEKYAPSIVDSRIRDLCQSWANDGLYYKKLKTKEQKCVFHALLLGGIARSMRREDIDLTPYSVADSINLLASDVGDPFFYDAILKKLKGEDRQAIEKLMIQAFDNSLGSQGCLHVAYAMGDLGYEAFLPSLYKELGGEKDALINIAADALFKYGVPVVSFLHDRLPAMSKNARFFVPEILERIGGPEAIACMDEFFELFWKDDRELCLGALDGLPDERFQSRLAPKAGKKQDLVDRTYLVISKLLGKFTPEMQALQSDYNGRRQEADEHADAFLSGRVVDSVRPVLELEMRCRSCEELNVYEVRKVVMSEKEGAQPFIVDEITCLECGKKDDMEVTSGGYVSLTAELMRLMVSGDREAMLAALERGPIRFTRTSVKGREMEIGKGVQLYLNDIAKAPDNPENYIGLGNIYRNLEEKERAEKYYLQALALDPLYIEPYFSLGWMAFMTEEINEAGQWLEKGRAIMAQAKYCKYLNGTISQFTAQFAELYNDVFGRTGSAVLAGGHQLSNRKAASSSQASSLPSAVGPAAVHPLKVGRNDPCPCGSGKKYKKCCLK